MRIDAITTFPAMFDSVMQESMMLRAQKKGLLEFHAHDLRDWTYDVHRTTDDAPYGGGHGLVMKCEPVYEALESVCELEEGSLPKQDGPAVDERTLVIIPAPQGKVLDDEVAERLSCFDRLVFVCGHYEGMDERIYAAADEVISIGDYILTGGELSSMVIIDAVVRKIPGVLGAQEGPKDESFSDGLLEYPQYTRPEVFRGMRVPEVLLSGHHANIEAWRRNQSIERTAELRPDLLEGSRVVESCKPDRI